MIAQVRSAACLGIEAYPVHIEVDVSPGLPSFNIVGLPDTSVRESRERVRSAIKNSGFSFPRDRITVNLAPADIKKEGPAFDLPMALGILAAENHVKPEKLRNYTTLGELALDGSLRPFRGAFVITDHPGSNYPFIFPDVNARECAEQEQSTVYAARNLKEVVGFLNGDICLEPVKKPEALPLPSSGNEAVSDYSEVRGQFFAKRAVEIAVAGGHNLLFVGSPGSGKSMMAKRIPSILPPLDEHTMLQITKIHSVSGMLGKDHCLLRKHPFRSPHHSLSAVAMAGGGSWPKPGEVSLAHGGVLFLDEFPEFRRDVIETLRAPLEDGKISISRAKMHLTYPAGFMLVAAMNPCPCGYLTHPRKACSCTSVQIQKYQSRISGPILDRIDLHVEVPTLTYSALNETRPAESSASIRARILACRKIQASRYRRKGMRVNALMSPNEIKAHASPCREGEQLIEMAMKELHLSARAYYKILKVARTIADLARSEKVLAEHIAEAIQYRSLDRK